MLDEEVRGHIGDAISIASQSNAAFMRGTRPWSLKAAIKAAGGVRSLARLLGITSQAIMQWKKVPAERMLEIEELTGIARERLRPDLCRLPPRYLEDADDEATVDAIERQKLAAHDPGQP